MELADKRDAWARLGVRVIAFCIDDPDDLKELQDELGFGVTLIADPTAAATKAFGMLDPKPFPDRIQARAGLFWLNTSREVRARWLPDRYRARPDLDEVRATVRAGLE